MRALGNSGRYCWQRISPGRKSAPNGDISQLRALIATSNAEMERTEPVTFWDPFPANLYGLTRAVATGSSGDDSDAAYRAVLRDRAAPVRCQSRS